MKHYPIIKHKDGLWHTSEHVILGIKCCIKMQEGKGCKIHIWNKENTKVSKTFKYNFSTEEYLLKKAEDWIKTKIL